MKNRKPNKSTKKADAPLPKGSWWNSYRQLLIFVERTGTARVPAEYVADNFQLGQWVRTQRTRKLRLSSTQKKALQSQPGWVWDVGDAQWGNAYRVLKIYVKKHKHARVPKGHVEQGFKLGQWVKTQRVRMSGLTRERVKALEELPGWVWSVNEARWEEHFANLTGFYKREGHLRVPADHAENGFMIGTWLYAQRRAYLTGHMPTQRKKRLDRLSTEWRRTAKQKKSGRGKTKRARFETMSPDSQTEAVYEALFGLGPMTEDEAVLATAEYVKSTGLADYRRFRLRGTLADSLRGAIDLSVEYGYFDRPGRGRIRAILPDANDYQPEEWEVCLLESIGADPLTRDEAIRRAVAWASENLGLRMQRVRKDSPVYKDINKTITGAIKTGEVKTVRPKSIQRVV